MQGWIKLHRNIQEHWLYQEIRSFSKFEAWVDMLMMANHSSNKFVLGNEIVEVERGSFITSIRKLGDRWKWSNKKVVCFLKLLRNDQMISFESNTKRTHIAIENYSKYQDRENTEETRREHTGNTQETQKHTNKNDKNDKEDIYTSEFEEFWSFYPNKKGKSGTYKHWKNLIKKFKPKDLIRAARNYANACKNIDKQFIKVGYNFFGDGVFMDYIELQAKTREEDEIVVTPDDEAYIKKILGG
ncbi:MAG: hypothetical protein ACOYVK_14700 [Bacillota bacterium]